MAKLICVSSTYSNVLFHLPHNLCNSKNLMHSSKNKCVVQKSSNNLILKYIKRKKIMQIENTFQKLFLITKSIS